jgi:hypothetical protein
MTVTQTPHSDESDTPERLRAAADHLSGRQDVAFADILPPELGPRDEWTIEATLAEGETARPMLLQTVAAHGLALCDLRPRAADVLLATLHRP